MSEFSDIRPERSVFRPSSLSAVGGDPLAGGRLRFDNEFLAGGRRECLSGLPVGGMVLLGL